ncbi:GNAT family N-acetyltransferase [Chitinibacter fontanus]|uniref:GNAT family N-acetyltransferase n=1 Tax=Chitinibacter fontanus TaxID=1737446 RepID=A0A7D5ZI24_9NEIS|nr:GNAT family N-acetyltransferase [Chitinibacter fontanus]QLI82708.1 GNAT family N-acetyltransferase [Chitinibacter fontanus]
MWSLASVYEADFEELLAIRIAAMRESLERIGRFDPERARQRLRANFEPIASRKILVANQVVGFYALREEEQGYALDHLYLLPQWQGQGIGSAVLTHIQQQCPSRPIRLVALRESDSNRFYQRHGFIAVTESEWDIDYIYWGISS